MAWDPAAAAASQKKAGETAVSLTSPSYAAAASQR